MGQNDLGIFIVLMCITILVFIIGLIIFIFQYRKNLLNNKVEVQRQTMQFIGGEIHDSVAQKLTLAAHYTYIMENNNQCTNMMEQLKAVNDIIDEALKELRRLAHTLNDDKIEQTEISLLLELQCDNINDTGICNATFHTNTRGTIPISNLVKRTLLRIVQEFIQNSLKHTKCKNINVELNYNEAGLDITASDDGKGFDINSKKGDGIGITNMRNRVLKIGGTFKLESSPGNGTKIYLFVPAQKLK